MRLLTLLGFIFLSQNAFCNGNATGKINSIDTRSNGDFLISISIDTQDRPACVSAENYRRMAGKISLAGNKVLIANALSAMAVKSTVNIIGSGLCTTFPGIEDVLILVNQSN